MNKRLRNSNAKMKITIDRYKTRISKLETTPYVSCFGGKNFFRNQPTHDLDDYDILHEEWKEEWQRRRHASFVILKSSTSSALAISGGSRRAKTQQF